MAYVYAWTTAGPVLTDLVRDGAEEIREGVKAALQERIQSVIANISNDPWQFKNIQAAVTNTYDIGTTASRFKAGYINALAVNTAQVPTAGNILLANTGTIQSRNAADLASLNMLSMDASNVLQLYNGAATLTSAGVLTSTTFVGALTGNASTATILQTARTINGVSFNGSANISITATSTGTLTFGTHLTSGGASYNGSANVTITSDATSANTVSTIVARDGAGAFSMGALTATSAVINGAVSGITTLAGTGAVSGFTTVDVTGNVTITKPSGNSFKFILAQTGVQTWNLTNIATTGAFQIDDGVTAALTIAKTTLLTTFAGSVTVSGTTTAVQALTATTIGANGVISTTAVNTTFAATGAATSARYINLSNTSGSAIFGVENSVGGTIIIGSVGYDFCLAGLSGISFSANNGSSTSMRIANTHAVTFTAGISATTGTFSADAFWASGYSQAGGNLGWASRTIMSCPADGRVLLTNNAGNDFGRMMFGGTSSSFPALKRSSAGLVCVLADDSASAAFECLSLKTANPGGIGGAGVWLLGQSAVNADTPCNRLISVRVDGVDLFILAHT